MKHNTVFIKSLTTAFLLLLTVSIRTAAQESTSALARYRDACITMVEGIDKHDKYTLYEAQRKLEEIELSPFSTLEAADEATKSNKEKPNFVFTKEGIDNIIANNFVLTELDSLSAMRRSPSAEVLTHYAAIAPGATLTWKSEAVDDCEMTIVWLPNAKLTLTVTDLDSGRTYEAIADSSGHAATVRWTMPPQTPKFSFSVHNDSDLKATFVVAIN